MPCTIYCLITLKRQLPLEEKLLNLTTMRSHEYCIADRMMKSSSATYHIKRYKRHSKMLMTVCVELTKLVQSLEIDSEDLDIIGWRWSLTPSPAKRCHACQIHGDFIHQAPGHLRLTTSSWLFEMWGMDEFGPISPPSSKGHWFILAITNYFSK